jgi:hypothetical protein
MSRIYGGIHFMSANRDSKACGAKIGQFVFKNCLLANTALPQLQIEAGQGAACQLRLHGHWGTPCVLERSSDLMTWQPLSTNQAVPGGAVVQLGNVSTRAGTFYRLREQE